MWQLFPLHNDGLGRKRWVNFPNSQQLEGVTSYQCQLALLLSLDFFFVFFLSVWQQGKVCAFTNFFFFQINKLKGIIMDSSDFSPFVLQI